VDRLAMIPNDDLADGVVVELLPGRRCSVRLNDGQMVVGRIPAFDSLYYEPYYPEPGHPVTVFLKGGPDLGGDILLVGFPMLRPRRA
jgi:hypothetical protein